MSYKHPRSSLSSTFSTLALALSVSVLGSCVDDIVIPDDAPPAALPIGQPRTVEVRFRRLDVKDYEQILTQEDLQQEDKFPRKILEDVWVLDYDMKAPVEEVLEQLSGLPPGEADKLPRAAQNMRRLLNMTADNVDLNGTKLEEMIGLAGAVGIPPAKVLAAMMGTQVSERTIPFSIAAEVLLELVLGSHPNAKFRLGPIDDEHPDGKYPISKNSLPITMWDVVSNFEDLVPRFGPTGDHPGFINSIEGLDIGKDAMELHLRANLNALPYKGIDLSSGYVANVNSTASQIESIFDFASPDWLTVTGLPEVVKMAAVTVTIVENREFLAGGDSQQPSGQGNSPIWDLPLWEFEHVLIEMARRRTASVPPHCDTYKLGTDVTAFEACVEVGGWTTMTTFTDIGNPPPPAYLWDLLAEVAQVRLHDGELAEGDGNVEFTLRDVEVALDEEAIIKQVKANIQANPKALARLAELLNDNADGDADFYYYRPNAADVDGDYLYFITEDDIRTEGGAPVRAYAYKHPGFYADAGLKQKLSKTTAIDGDDTHEKLKVSPGQVVFSEDDAGHVYQIAVGDKPTRSALTLTLTRVK